jgi:nitric oxide reductase large subunit
MLVVVFIVMIVFVGLISWGYGRWIDYMKENHPDYKGDDFLSTSAGRDLWDEYDEDTVHTEGEF